MSRTRLYADTESRVLWLSRRRAELALSEGGVWLRDGRREADVPWPALDQVQVRPGGGWGASVDVFTPDQTYRVGPFPRREASVWVSACGSAAAEAGYDVLQLDGAEGFAMSCPTGGR